MSALDDLNDATARRHQQVMTTPIAPCATCKGACCESFAIPLPPDPGPDVVRWLGYRGEIHHRALRIELPCSMLSDGACTIWTSRPQPCRDYLVGGSACRDAIAARRPSPQREHILDILEAWLASRPPGPSS
jgi:hypothetical protein